MTAWILSPPLRLNKRLVTPRWPDGHKQWGETKADCGFTRLWGGLFLGRVQKLPGSHWGWLWAASETTNVILNCLFVRNKQTRYNTVFRELTLSVRSEATTGRRLDHKRSDPSPLSLKRSQRSRLEWHEAVLKRNRHNEWLKYCFKPPTVCYRSKRSANPSAESQIPK